MHLFAHSLGPKASSFLPTGTGINVVRLQQRQGSKAAHTASHSHTLLTALRAQHNYYIILFDIQYLSLSVEYYTYTHSHIHYLCLSADHTAAHCGHHYCCYYYTSTTQQQHQQYSNKQYAPTCLTVEGTLPAATATKAAVTPLLTLIHIYIAGGLIYCPFIIYIYYFAYEKQIQAPVRPVTIESSALKF